LKELCQPKGVRDGSAISPVPSFQKLQEKAGYFPALESLRANLACLILLKPFLEKFCKKSKFFSSFSGIA
jgi:hypothetical protein